MPCVLGGDKPRPYDKKGLSPPNTHGVQKVFPKSR